MRLAVWQMQRCPPWVAADPGLGKHANTWAKGQGLCVLCYSNCKGAVAGLGADRRDAVERLAHDADLADGVGPLDAAERAPRRAVRAHRQADARRGGVAVGLHGGKAANLELRADGGGVLRADGRVDGVHALLDLFHKGSGGWRAC